MAIGFRDLSEAGQQTVELFAAALLTGTCSMSCIVLDRSGLHEFVQLGLASTERTDVATLTAQGINVVRQYLGTASAPLLN